MKITASGPAVIRSGQSDWKPCLLDPSGFGHIKDMLTGIYGDSKGSVLREYAANALDSQRLAGTDTPVVVGIPTELHPVLTITDHGVGLSEAEVENVYANYGSSTKRGSNDYIGAFGIGSKSAFALSSSFTVTAVKDGRKTISVFSLHEGAPGHEVVARVATVEPNGVTISIPVNMDDIDDWRRAAVDTFTWFTPGSVQITGVEIEWALKDARRVTSEVWMTNKKVSAPFMVLIGGVPCSGSTVLAQVDESLTRHRLVLDLPVGSVDLLPNREQLRDTPRTREAVAAAVKKARQASRAAFWKASNAAPTVLDKVVVISEYAELGQVLEYDTPYPDVKAISLSELGIYTASRRDPHLTPATIASTVFVDQQKVSTVTVERAARNYRNPWRFSTMYAHKAPLPQHSWFDPDHPVIKKITWAQLREHVNPTRATVRAPITYRQRGTQRNLTVQQITEDPREVVIADISTNILDEIQPGWDHGKLVVSTTGSQQVSSAVKRLPGATLLSALTRKAAENFQITDDELRVVSVGGMRPYKAADNAKSIVSKLTPGTPAHTAFSLLHDDLRRFDTPEIYTVRILLRQYPRTIPKHPAAKYPGLLWCVTEHGFIPEHVVNALVAHEGEQNV